MGGLRTGCRPFPSRDPVLDARLRDVSARFFVALNGASFGRCDLRVDRDGTPYMLEINPNCGVYYRPEMPAAPTSASRTTRRATRASRAGWSARPCIGSNGKRSGCRRHPLREIELGDGYFGFATG